MTTITTDANGRLLSKSFTTPQEENDELWRLLREAYKEIDVLRALHKETEK